MDSIEKNNYYINMFQNNDKNIILDEKQIKKIKDNSKIILVIAGAGSGKTTTMAAKVKYLIEKKNVRNDEILIISYTNKAVTEIDDLVNNKFNLDVKICTFHKFAYDLIKDEKYKIINNNEKIYKNIIKKNRYSKFIYKELKKDYINTNYLSFQDFIIGFSINNRSEERRVGKECVRTCYSLCW